MDHGNVRNTVKGVLFSKPRKGEKAQPSLLNTEPFKAGYDEELVRTALEKIVTMDPQGMTPGDWSKETLLKLAGPIVFAAEELQINDAMFGGARKASAQALLRKYGYREAYDGDAANLAKRSFLQRDMRLKVTFKDAFLTPGSVKKFPSYYRDRLDDLHLWLQESPVKVLSEKAGEDDPPILTPLTELIELVENDKSGKPLPSIEPEVEAMFKTELARAGDAEAQLKLCRKELENPARKNYYRKMFAMSHLINALGVKALPDVSPFLGHTHWRLSKRAEELVVDLVKKGSGDVVIALLKSSLAGESGLQGNLHAAGVFAALVKANCKAAQPVALTALKHADPVVRRAAIQAVFTLGGDAELKTVFAFLDQATEPEDFEGCEFALLSRREDPAHVKRVSEQARALVFTSTPARRKALTWVLGQFGGAENLGALQKAALAAIDENDLQNIIRALAFSPDRGADQVMIALAKQDKKIREVVAAHSVYRMVGRHGTGDVTDTQRMDFAEPMLQLKPDTQLIAYVGKIYTGRAVKALFEVMKLGNTDTAALAIINAAGNMEKKPEAERAIAAEVLASVIEYIEVTKLRGGYAAHSMKEDNYAGWKVTQAMAGQALLKIHKPKAAPIPTFNDKDLDL
jgi:hypothetical protein